MPGLDPGKQSPAQVRQPSPAGDCFVAVRLAMTGEPFTRRTTRYTASSGACSRVPLQMIPPRSPISTLP